MHSVAVELSNEAHRLRPELRDPSDAAAKRHRPHVAAAGLPVGGDDGRHRDEPAFFQVVVDEVLRQELIHTGTVPNPPPTRHCLPAPPASSGPVALGQRWMGLRPASPVPDTYLLLWATENRSSSPDQLSWLPG